MLDSWSSSQHCLPHSKLKEVSTVAEPDCLKLSLLGFRDRSTLCVFLPIFCAERDVLAGNSLILAEAQPTFLGEPHSSLLRSPEHMGDTDLSGCSALHRHDPSVPQFTHFNLEQVVWEGPLPGHTYEGARHSCRTPLPSPV